MTQGASRPNILLIITDHWRGDSLGRLGHPAAETPHLDELSTQGITFTHGYTPSPSCIPARRSLMTGMTPSSHGMVGYLDGKPWSYEHTLAGELAKAGYQTINVGKTHFHPKRLRLGFHELVTIEDYDEWVDAETGVADAKWAHGVPANAWFGRPNHLSEDLMEESWLVGRAIDLLQKRDPTLPFFLCLSLKGPHPPWCPPKSYYDMFIDRPMPGPVVGQWAERHKDDAIMPMPAEAWRGVVPPEVMQRSRAAYYAYLAYIDAQLGRLFRSMGDLYKDNCMVVFTSDHGEMLGDHNLWRKTYGYEGSARIPFIVRPPIDRSAFPTEPEGISVLDTTEVLSGRRNIEMEQVVGWEDIMPTFLDAAGVSIPSTVEGSSLMPLIRGEDVSWREFYHVEHSPCYHPENAHQTLTDGKWKFIWNPITGEEQLFHLADDPGELEDLASDGDYNGELSAWRRRLVKHLEGRPEQLSDGESLTPNHVPTWRGG